MKNKYIFIIGNSRSGTTMVGRILNRSSEVFTFRELHYFEQICTAEDLYKTLSEKSASKLLAQLIALQRDGYLLVKNISQDYLDDAISHVRKYHPSNAFDVYRTFLEYETIRNNKSIPCEQTPRNLLYMTEILNYFKTEARVIAMVRDPRDVLLSQKRKWKRKRMGMPEIPWHESVRTWMNYHPITISLLWVSSINASKMYKSDERVLHIKYEALVNSSNRTLEKICDFTGLSYDPEMLQITMRDSSNRNDDKSVIGIDSSRVGQWKNKGLNEAEVYLCQKITKLLMQEFGYEQITIQFKPTLILMVILYLLVFPFKIIIAFALNLHRMKNPVQAVRMRVMNLFEKNIRL